MNNKKIQPSREDGSNEIKRRMHAMMSKYGKVRSLEVLTVDPRPDHRLLVIFDSERDAQAAALALGGTRLGLSGVKLTL
jgi:hypothetical protein